VLHAARRTDYSDPRSARHKPSGMSAPPAHLRTLMQRFSGACCSRS
jgi:hypothetical protein